MNNIDAPREEVSASDPIYGDEGLIMVQTTKQGARIQRAEACTPNRVIVNHGGTRNA